MKRTIQKTMRSTLCIALALVLVAGLIGMTTTASAVEREFNCEILFAVHQWPGHRDQVDPGLAVITIRFGGEHSGRNIVGATWPGSEAMFDDNRTDHEGVNIYLTMDDRVSDTGWTYTLFQMSKPEGADIYVTITPPRGWVVYRAPFFTGEARDIRLLYEEQYDTLVISYRPMRDYIIRWYLVPEAPPERLQPVAPNLNTATPWAHIGINSAIDLGLVPQNLQNHYRNTTTRAEFAALAVALYETVTGREITGRMEFNDTNDVNVKKMGYLDVVRGVGGDNFAPDSTLTREQAAVMLARLAEAIGQPLAQAAPTFADNAQVSAWAVDAVGQVQAAEIMGGIGDNRFAPGGDYTREQSIVTMLRLFDLLG